MLLIGQGCVTPPPETPKTAVQNTYTQTSTTSIAPQKTTTNFTVSNSTTTTQPIAPNGTYFALYCHSGGSSGALQKPLAEMFPQYHIINIAGGIGLCGFSDRLVF